MSEMLFENDAFIVTREARECVLIVDKVKQTFITLDHERYYGFCKLTKKWEADLPFEDEVTEALAAIAAGGQAFIVQ